MSRSFGFIALILVAGAVMYLYMKNTVGVSPGGEGGKAGPKATIDIVGVKNDLNAIAQGERRYWATNSKYASIDDLRADGDISYAVFCLKKKIGNVNVDFRTHAEFRQVDARLDGEATVWNYAA